MSQRNINEYTSIVGESVIEELFILADKLRGKTIQNINSTAVGGGVAEILARMVPLLKQLGVDARWDVIKGNERFFLITKKIHNALHGVNVTFSDEEFDYFKQVNAENAGEMASYGDVVFVHDSQPIGLIEKKNELGRKWVWRCHIDFTQPTAQIEAFLRDYIERYDSAVFSAQTFSRHLSIPQVLIAPSIDPLSDKNRDMAESEIWAIVERYGIDPDRPIVTQISRFDYLKDPVGVIDVYRKVKEHVDCQLVLAGGGATDDPEGARVLEDVQNAAADDPDIHVLLLPPGSDLEINALQRASSVVLQKSLKEGFGLTVAEALWKAKPVIAGAVGGIPQQITHKFSGILTYSIDGTVYYLKQLLNDQEYAKRLGANGREHVKNNFLITRHIRDYILLFLSLYHNEDVVQF